MSNTKEREVLSVGKTPEVRQDPPQASSAVDRICSRCGEHFILRRDFEGLPPRIPPSPVCYQCARDERKKRAAEKAEREDRLWQQKKAADYEAYLRLLPDWPVVPMDSIRPQADRVLYILGNGFDLMHGVPSTYYSFRDSLGKSNALRSALETFWTPRDLWADFENALAKFNARAMSSAFMVDNYLDLYDAYDEDAGAAEFYMAAEAAAHPIISVADALPRRFRMWVDSLRIGTEDRPLRDLVQSGKVLCFNYTEFVEDLYGIPQEQVCYIHGCRRRRKHEPAEELILGHQPGASDAAFDYEDKMPKWAKQPYKRHLIESAQEVALQIISEYDDTLTKHSPAIIAKHRAFFEDLQDIREIVVIGHSLSSVDWDYFRAVCGGLRDPRAVHWYFGCHGLQDLQNLKKLIRELDLPLSCLSVFRTDGLRVTLKPSPVSTAVHPAPQSKVRREDSEDQQWTAEYSDRRLRLIHRPLHTVDYETNLPDAVQKVHFTPSGTHLLAVVRGYPFGVLLFASEGGHWRFVDELCGIPNQGLLNRRLHRVLWTEDTITFVYNSRVRVYALRDGSLLQNRQVRNARAQAYEGLDISHWFVRGDE